LWKRSKLGVATWGAAARAGVSLEGRRHFGRSAGPCDAGGARRENVTLNWVKFCCAARAKKEPAFGILKFFWWIGVCRRVVLRLRLLKAIGVKAEQGATGEIERARRHSP
jgi:hypothetical protein